MKTSTIPEGFHTLTPYVTVHDARKLIEFLKHTFDAKEIYCSNRPDKTIAYARVQVGDSMIEISDASERANAMNVAIHVFVDDVDKAYKNAVEAGAFAILEPADKFYGSREAYVEDPCGNLWYIATPIEDVSYEEMRKRIKDFQEKEE